VTAATNAACWSCSVTRRAAALVPGLVAVAAVVALAALGARVGAGLSAAILALGLGAVLAPLARRSPGTRPGIDCAATTLLRSGIVLLGLSIALGDLGRLGLSGFAIAAVTLVVTLTATQRLAPRLGVPADLALLIGAGSAICGASAIAALQPVARAREADVGYAVATVSLFGTTAMLLVPLLGPVLGLDADATGVWAGASIHEVAQVAGAGAALPAAALKIATLTKLARVALLAPTVAVVAGGRGRRRVPIAVPPFLLAFAACVVARSVLPLPAAGLHVAHMASGLLLAAGLAALGLRLNLAALRAAGPRPLALGLLAALVAGSVALAGVVVFGV
jgi:uncharacterized integral membrane protein (TIGR00698 family)